MFRLLRSKKDARLYFRYLCNTPLHKKVTLDALKNWLIRKDYIDHVEGDRYLELRKMDKAKIIKEIMVDFEIECSPLSDKEIIREYHHSMKA